MEEAQILLDFAVVRMPQAMSPVMWPRAWRDSTVMLLMTRFSPAAFLPMMKKGLPRIWKPSASLTGCNRKFNPQLIL
jgi:hypothetical protein